VVPGAILAQPALVHGTIVIKAIDGYLRGLSIADGHELWSFQQVEPSLLLRGASAPLIHQRSVIAGFANGNLAKVDSDTGQVVWLRQIAEPEGAFAIQRMVDIDADPIMFDYHLYAATYQGNIASLDWISGKILWSHELSSYTGMSASENSIYISDANGFIWSFNAKNGLINWRQMELAYRGVTGPAIIGNYVVVGDKQGYLHWLDKNDGHYAGRIKVGSGPIFSAPIVKNNVLYAINNQGSLSAYTLD
jgi:outer membrane protein assembly factor BamB